jgi:hypothetical protein
MSMGTIEPCLHSEPVNRLTDVMVGNQTLVLLSWKNPERMCTKVVTLRLDHVGREHVTAITIEERQGSCESRDWDTPEGGLSTDTPPTRLRLVNGYKSSSACRFVA